MSTEMILVQTVVQMKAVLAEHAHLIPVLIVTTDEICVNGSANRSEVMRTSDKLESFKR